MRFYGQPSHLWGVNSSQETTNCIMDGVQSYLLPDPHLEWADYVLILLARRIISTTRGQKGLGSLKTANVIALIKSGGGDGCCHLQEHKKEAEVDEKEEEDYEIQDATMLYIGHRQRIFRNFEYRSFAVIEGYIGVTEGSGGGGGGTECGPHWVRPSEG